MTQSDDRGGKEVVRWIFREECWTRCGWARLSDKSVRLYVVVRIPGSTARLMRWRGER